MLRPLVIISVIAALASTAAAERALVVVVAKSSPITSISRTELKRCFLGEPVVVGGKPLVPFNAMPSSPERAGFDDAVLGMSPAEVGRFWVDRKVRGQSGAPRSLPSQSHIVKVVAKFPNAISYVPADQVTADLRPLIVDGVAPTDPKYPIRVR